MSQLKPPEEAKSRILSFLYEQLSAADKKF